MTQITDKLTYYKAGETGTLGFLSVIFEGVPVRDRRSDWQEVVGFIVYHMDPDSTTCEEWVAADKLVAKWLRAELGPAQFTMDGEPTAQGDFIMGVWYDTIASIHERVKGDDDGVEYSDPRDEQEERRFGKD